MSQKWNLQDIRPSDSDRHPRRQNKNPNAPQQRSQAINDQSTAPRQRQSSNEAKTEQAPRRETKTKVSSNQKKSKRNSNSNRRGTVIAVCFGLICILLGGYFYTLLSSGAEVTVYARSQQQEIDTTLRAFNEPQPDQLSYSVMTLEASSDRQVESTGEETVTESATGEIVISNETVNSQRLVASTRFESPEGNIYRISEPVLVPAASQGEIGTVRTTVTADEAGESYNVPTGTSFTIPGYDEGGFAELFASITAESVTAIDGGFEGPRYQIDEETLAATQDSLQTELRASLLDRIATEKPANTIVFPNAATFTYQTQPSTEAEAELVTLTEEASMRVPVFNQNDLAAAIASSSIIGFDNAPVRIENPDTLSFSYTGTSTEDINLAADESIVFRLSGIPYIVWTYDEANFRGDIAGRPQTALTQIIGKYSGIESAEAVISPFWSRSFPNDIDEITVTEVLEPTS